ncbi:MAG: TonB-dependent receptor [Verrucomicrobiota bacterium]
MPQSFPILLLTLFAQTELPETLVLAERLPANPPEATFSFEDLSSQTALTLDQILLTDPAVSLFRRQDATFANPTAAGLSLRRTGATATSRTLVLRDGIPQNDPFGSWLSWTRYQPGLLESVRLQPAAQAAAWGNQSPAGTLHLTTRLPTEPFHQTQLTYGSCDTLQFSTTHDFLNPDRTLALQATAYHLQTDGHIPVQPSQRGPIDTPLKLDAQGLDLRSLWKPSDQFTLDATLSLFQEDRNNGTALTRNATDAHDLSLRATYQTPELTHQATLYYQSRNFESVFTSQAADRSSESIALDQFDVPATGLGGSYSLKWSPHDTLSLTLGLDARHLDGETNERVTFGNRLRTAGGTQTFLGAFTQLSTQLPHNLQLDASARLDSYHSHHGSLRLQNPDGTFLTNDTFPDRDLLEPSFGLTLSRQMNDLLHLSASTSTSFRAPTLNELYRPFRIGSTTTSNNPNLNPERFHSAELTATLTPSEQLKWRNTLFAHSITDAIANVPLTDTSAQRLNVDHARVLGLESRLAFQPSDTLTTTLAYQFTDTRFTDSPLQPNLENEPFPHSPRHRLHAAATWQPTPKLSLGADTTFSSHIYDDALATRRLDSAWQTGLSATYQLTDHLTLLARIDNLFDQDLQTGLNSNNILTLAPPRTLLLTTRYLW